MRTLLLSTVLVLGVTAAAPSTALCPVQVTSRVPWLPWLGRTVTITPSLACAQADTAFVRFRSRTGSQPDAPPGYFSLKRGDRLTRLVPRDWWVEERGKYFRWKRVPEGGP